MTRMIEVQVLSRDEGTIVAFTGTDMDTNEVVEFAVDHRMAQPLADAISEPGEMPPLVEIEEWQVLGVGLADA